MENSTFASSCLDRTVKIWSLGSPHANSTLEAHETKGVNHVDYYPLADRPYLLTTSDDRTCKVWDYTTKSLIATLEGHTNNVSFAVYHPELPIIVSGSEDGTIRLWNSNTYRLEQSLSYGLERAWCIGYQKGKQGIAVGFDDGAVVVKLGREEPAVSMDSSGKLIWARHNEVLSAIIKGGDATVKDGAPIPLTTKDLGTSEVYPQSLLHSPNGRFVSVWYVPLQQLSRCRAELKTDQCEQRRWRVHHLHSPGVEEQGIWLSSGLCKLLRRPCLIYSHIQLTACRSGHQKRTAMTLRSGSQQPASRSTRTLSRSLAAWTSVSRPTA